MEHVVILSDVRLDGPPFNCVMCDKNMADIFSLRDHFFVEHLNMNITNFLVENYSNECTSNQLEGMEVIESQGEQQKDQAQERDMEGQIKVVERKGKAHLECPICNKSYSQKSSRDRHVRELHEQPRRFACSQCELRFSNQSNLRTHQRRIHSITYEKAGSALKCPHCPREYSKKSVLNKHILASHKNKNESKAERLPIESANSVSETEENDPQSLAESVLEELKQLQRAIADTEHERANVDVDMSHKITAENTSIDAAIVEEVTIKDRLYPCDMVTEYKVQRIKRSDGYYYHVCEYCSKEFRKPCGYIRHRRIHTKIRPFICVLCKKAFPTQTELKRHCSVHVLDENRRVVYKCPKCLEAFTTITLFDRHLSSHSPLSRITFNCKQCPKSFNSLKLYFNHSHKEVDPELDMLKSCLPSPLCVVEDEERGQHVIHRLMGDFRCSICDLGLPSVLSLKQHEKRHHNLWKYQCNICKCFYASKSSLIVHTRGVHRNHRLLKRHKAKNTGSAKNYRCRYCDKAFTTALYCRRHMMSHIRQLLQTNEATKSEETNVESLQTIIENYTDRREIIIKEFEIPRKPKRNAKINKPAEEDLKFPYRCLQCSRRFRYNGWLKKHMAENHTKERPYKCDICFKGFRKNQTLKIHLLTHQACRTKVTCQVCGKQYSTQKSLNVHLRIHTESRPFQCELCTKSFRTSGHLLHHHKAKHQDQDA